MSYWICAEETPSSPHFYYFQKEFEAAPNATFTVRCSGDTRYALYLNGHLVSEGPCQGSSYQTYYETEDLTAYLIAGKNRLEAKVLYVTDGYFISVYRRSRPAFWLDGTLTVDGTDNAIGTDATWVCEREEACTFHNGPGVHTSIPPYENWSGATKRTSVSIKQMYAPDLKGASYNIFGLAEPYVLRPRLIPQMETEAARPLTVIRQGTGFVELDASAYTTSKISAVFRAKAGTTVRFIWAECYTVVDENGNRFKSLRDAYEDPTAASGGVWDSVTATGEKQSFVPFWYRSFRFVRVEFEPDSDFQLLELSQSPYHYPMDHAGTFACSDERFNEMWKISRNTVLSCMHEMYVDCPYYEQQQYQMDSALEMLFTLRMTADGRMPYKSLLDLSHSQMADGMLQANYPSTSVQIIPDFTLFWVLMLRDYLRYTGRDDETLARIRALTGTMDKALGSFEPYITKDGLVGVTPYWHFVDWVPAWHVGVPTGGREEPITVTSLMYVAALRAAAAISDTVGRVGLAADYRARADQMQMAVRKHCYDECVGLYRDTPNTKSYSQHTTLWAILSDSVTGDDAGALVDRTFDGHVPVHMCTFSMSHYMFRALEKAGRYTPEYVARQLSGWQKMLDLHCTSWCENPDSPRSECHGWSSAPIYEFSAMVLGVMPTSDGYRTVRIKPYPDAYPLTWARGTVPTPVGPIEVAWEKENQVFTLHVTLPADADMPTEIILPDGTTRALSAGEGRYTCQI